MWSEGAESSQLIDLRLPVGFHATSAWLKALAAKHSLIEHFSIISPCQKITTDSCENPFEHFKNLKSLSVELENSGTWRGCSGCDQTHRDHERNLRSIASLLDKLPLTSLELSRIFGYGPNPNDDGIWSEAEGLIPGPFTTPNLVKTLVHLRINNSVRVQDAEYLLFHCRRLETLHLDSVELEEDGIVFGEYPPLIESHLQMSPVLHSATFAFSAIIMDHEDEVQ